jgi:Mg2+ and Co2+ transporter CorA
MDKEEERTSAPFKWTQADMDRLVDRLEHMNKTLDKILKSLKGQVNDKCNIQRNIRKRS